MSNPSVSEPDLGYILTDVSRLMRRDFERRVSSLGLTLTQWRAIAHLSREEGINQSVLADLLDVTPITLTRLIDRMEDAGWIERQRDPDDRRAVRLYLTPKVQPVLDDMNLHADATRQRAFHGISASAQRQAMRTLTRMKENLLHRNTDGGNV